MTYLLDVPKSPVKSPVRHPLTPAQWRTARVEATRRAKLQMQGFESSEIFKASIEAKLTEAGCSDRWFLNMKRCGQESFYIMCPNCGDGHEASYQCSNKICPRCNWRIANRRRELLEKITAGMPNTLLHVVLTQRNFYDDLAGEIKRSRANLLRLRRQKIFGKISGGCASMEITNEKKGWHLHWHLLVAATGFFDAHKLAAVWGQLVGQDFAIVKTKPVAEGSYLQEICKYAAKGSDIAKWKPSQIKQFVDACQRVRMFTVFGQFAKIRKYAAQLVKLERSASRVGKCPCGCDTAVFGLDRRMCERLIEEGKF